MSAKRRLKQARKVRHQRAHALKLLERGEISIESVIHGENPVLEGMDVWDVLLRVPKLGREGAKKSCIHAQVWAHTPLRELDAKQRTCLIRALPQRVKRQSRDA